MKNVKLLDCTLRDGAYLIDKKFGEENINGIIQGLVDAGIDFVEVGFFQNDGFGEGKTVYRNSADAAKYIPKDKQGSKFTVLADCSRYDISCLDEMSDDSVDAVRECFFKQERRQAMINCRRIKEKGYLCFVQPVDIMGYSDKELLELLEEVNSIEPYCFSIVDTFGSMYQEDLRRLIDILDYNLIPACRLGFHSHNNMQLSSALSQDFIRMTMENRKVVIDGTLSGMGRGAGNTPTELIAQYIVSKRQGKYNMDALLDTLDTYMERLRSRCKWGYTTGYFVAGTYSAHVNNIAYLMEKNSIRSKDMRYILNKIGVQARKRYDYELLEKSYMEYMESDLDDTDAIRLLNEELSGKRILLLVPGKTVHTMQKKIMEFSGAYNPITIAVNFIPEYLNPDYLYMSNRKRYQYWSANEDFKKARKIITSNFPKDVEPDAVRVCFSRLIKPGWEHSDNSALMVLRLLDLLDVEGIYIAGFDGYEPLSQNYYSEKLELPQEDVLSVNREISEMVSDYMKNRTRKDAPITFITPSRFDLQDD